MTARATPEPGHIARGRGSSWAGATPAPPEGHPVTDTLPFADFRPAELAPDQRAAAVAAVLAAGLLRVLRPEHFSHSTAGENSQGIPGEST